MGASKRRGPDTTTSSAEANTFNTLDRDYNADSRMISGRGKYHSNKNGDKPYLRVTLADVRNMVDNPPSLDKDQAQWLIPSTRDIAPLTAWVDRIADLRRQDDEAASAVLVAREAAKKRREAIRAANVGSGMQSLIHAFNAAYSVEDILVQAGYDQRGKHFRHPNSETGSFSASVKDGRVHTLSSADPLYTGGGGGGAHDPFSAFEALFHQGARGSAQSGSGAASKGGVCH